MASKKSLNAGVQAGIGFEFQKNCALLIYLTNYDRFANSKFFLCVEHHDDFLYCNLNDANEICMVSLYQAKKATEKWGMDANDMEIIHKLAEVGCELLADNSAPKTTNYSHKLSFITNNTIEFSTPKAQRGTNKYKIDEANPEIQFSNMPLDVQNYIRTSVSAAKISAISQISNLSFAYIDLGRTYSAQYERLIGAFSRTFGDKVPDHKAAVDTLLLLLKGVELEFNPGETAELLNPKKRVTWTAFESAINLITNEKKAFEEWRKCAKSICTKLKIPAIRQNGFNIDVQNCFDYFKDSSMREHKLIQSIVTDAKSIHEECFTDEDCIERLVDHILNEHQLGIEENQIKAAVCAAYVEAKVNP